MDRIALIRHRLEDSREQYGRNEYVDIIRTGIDESWDALASRVDFESASLYVFSKRSQSLHKLSEYGGGVNFINLVAFDYGPGLSGWVAKKQRPVYLADIHRGTRHGHAPIRSYLSQPINSHEDVIGVMNLAHTEPNAFERQQMAVIRSYIENLKPILEIYQRYHHVARTPAKNDFTRR
ncbi:MAG TPA: GAF domain-containing protein [Bacteroidetes bacterium]|nr:GAF domain-containing protein [Bacteroidota bacterium]